jgi:L-iditol 2-dehydrogenase
MPVQAKAVCFTRADTAELLEVSYEDPGRDEMIVAMRRSGISAGTEGSIFRGIRTENGTFPLITGYQGAGVVEWAGDAVTDFGVGDRVAVIGVDYRLIEPDFNIVWGTHCSRVIPRTGAAMPIPEQVSDDEASLVTLWAVGLHGITVSEVQADETVLVVGLGLIGLSFVQCALAAGATVVGLDLSEQRAALCRKLGAEAFTEQDQVRAWLDERDLRGFEVSVDATGNARAVDIPLSFAGPGGKFVWQGWYPGRVDFRFHEVHGKQLRFFFPCSTGGHQPRMLELIAEGKFNARDLISHHFPPEQCQEAYDLAVLNPGDCLGVVLEWPET